MKTKEQVFFDEYNKLIKSIKKTDKSIKDSEIDAFYELVKNEVILEETSTTREDSSFFTEFDFENLQEASSDSKDTFKKFINFIALNKNVLEQKLKDENASKTLKSRLVNAAYESNNPRDLMTKLKIELESF